MKVLTRENIKHIVANPGGLDYDFITYSDYVTRGLLPELELLPDSFKMPLYQSEYVFTEFTSFCRKMQQPDFGTIHVTIEPNEMGTIEMRSLRDYLIGFRDFNIFQEEVCLNVLVDVVRKCSPKYCEVKGVFTPRGGMTTIAKLVYKDEE